MDAAASTTDAMREIGAAWERRGGTTVRFDFGASSELARQIEAGARVDVFVSADAAKMDELQAKAFVLPTERHDLLSNQLAVVVPPASAATIENAGDLGRLQKIATGETTSVPLGIYARGWLTRAGVWNVVSPHLVSMVDARAAVAAVETESVDAAIVYKSDVATAHVRLALLVPSVEAPRIVYPIAAVGSTPSAAALAFVDFLSGAEARRIFEAHGFVVLP